MPGVTVGSKWGFAFVSRMSGQNGINVKYFQADAITGLDPPIQEFVNVVCGTFAAAYKPLLAGLALYRGVTARELGVLLPIVYFSTTGQGVGTATGDPLPPQTAGLITVRGPGALRHNHGRVYIPFPAEDSNATNGGVSVLYGTNADTLGDLFVGNQTYTLPVSVTTVTGRWYLAPGRGQGVQTFISSRNSRGFWATQRRRSLLNRSDLVIV